MSAESDKQRVIAEAAVEVISERSPSMLAAIVSTIGVLLEIADNRGIEPDRVLKRCQRDLPVDLGIDGGLPDPDYAVLLRVQAEDPQAAKHLVTNALHAGGREEIYSVIGTPFQSIPDGAEDIGIEQLTLVLSLPDGSGGQSVRAVELYPCA